MLLMLLPKARMNSSVLAMLPAQTMGTLPPALNDGFMQRLDKQLVWLVSPGKQANPEAAKYWLSLLNQSQAVNNLKGPMDAQSQQASQGTFFWQHRNALLDSATRARLQNGGDAQAQWVLTQLYSAFSGVSGKELQNDPLMLMRGAQLAMAQNNQKLRLMDGWLVTQDDKGNNWYLLHGELAGSSFDMQQTHQFVNTLASLETQLKARFPQAQLLSRGTVFYSDYASQQAKRDVSTLGIATILGVIVLIVAVFRSLRPPATVPDFNCHWRAGGHRRYAAPVRRTASDDAGDEPEHHRDFGRLHALLPDRTDGARRRGIAMAKSRQSA